MIRVDRESTRTGVVTKVVTAADNNDARTGLVVGVGRGDRGDEERGRGTKGGYGRDQASERRLTFFAGDRPRDLTTQKKLHPSLIQFSPLEDRKPVASQARFTGPAPDLPSECPNNSGSLPFPPPSVPSLKGCTSLQLKEQRSLSSMVRTYQARQQSSLSRFIRYAFSPTCLSSRVSRLPPAQSRHPLRTTQTQGSIKMSETLYASRPL